MKKLPKMFKNNINKPLNNNSKVFYSRKDNYQEISIDDLFKQNAIYRTNTLITLNNGNVIEKTIIGRSIKHLITIENELIPIDNIKSIKKGK